MKKETIKTVDIVSPALREEENIRKVVRKVNALNERDRKRSYQLIIIVNSNDTDSTPVQAKRLEKRKNFLSVFESHESPQFGQMILLGLHHANSDAVVIMMSDLSDDPRFIPEFISKLNEGVDVVHGSRFKNESVIQGYGVLRLIMNRTFNKTLQWILGLDTNDISNAFKAYRTSVINEIGLENVKSRDFDLTLELALRSYFMNFSHAEVPVNWTDREYGSSNFGLLNNGAKHLWRVSTLTAKSKIYGL